MKTEDSFLKLAVAHVSFLLLILAGMLALLEAHGEAAQVTVADYTVATLIALVAVSLFVSSLLKLK